MTDETTIETLEAEISELKGENDRLRKHNDTLLGEKKTAVTEAAQASEKAQALEAEMSGYREAPITQALEDVAIPGMTAYLRRAIEDSGHTIGEVEGALKILDGEGQPIGDLDRNGICALGDNHEPISHLIRALNNSGGGAPGATHRAANHYAGSATREQQPQPTFGLK